MGKGSLLKTAFPEVRLNSNEVALSWSGLRTVGFRQRLTLEGSHCTSWDWNCTHWGTLFCVCLAQLQGALCLQNKFCKTIGEKNRA